VRGWALAQRTGRERAGWESGGEFALVTDRWKLVRRAGGEEELYDLASDPGERYDVSERNREAVTELERTLENVLRRRPASQPLDANRDGTVPDDQLDALRSLGYVDE
jgi:arylsulfatase A-like enzyme